MTISKSEGPEWLRPFLSGQYFTQCKYHTFGKSEKNHFCIDCTQGPLCSRGVQLHAGHNTLQVRKASHMDAVRLNDIQKYLDISNIQAYTINGAKITFLLSRPHSKLAKAGFHCCEMCGRSIADPVRFCSIGCKLECAKQKRDDTSVSLSLHWEEYGAHDFYEAGEYRSSGKASDTPPMLCDSEDDMHSDDNPIALPMKKLMADQWDIEHVESPLKKFKSHKLIDRSAQSREKEIVHEISFSPLSFASVGDPGDSWSTLSTRKRLFSSEWLLQSNQQTSVTSRNNGLPSLKAQRRKGIPQRAPLF